MSDDGTFFASSANDDLASRLLTTQFGQYLTARFDGVNRSGWQPLCDKVLVMCDEAAELSSGGIEFTDTTKEQTGFAAITGVLIAAGPQAFAYDSHRLVLWEGERPKAGHRVTFRKYAGQEYVGRDGLKYRIMEDRQIDAIEILVPEEENADGQ